MDTSPKQKILLVLLAVLAAIKLILLPILDWQDEKAQRIATLAEQLEKGSALLSRQAAMQEELSALNMRKQALHEKLLSEDSSTTAFQLRTQKVIDELLNKYQLSTRNTNWMGPQKKDVAIEHRLELSLNGSVKQLMLFLMEVEKISPKINVLEVSSVISDMRPAARRLGEFNGRLVLSAWQQEAV